MQYIMLSCTTLAVIPDTPSSLSTYASLQSEQAYSLLLHALPPQWLLLELIPVRAPLLEHLQSHTNCGIR